MNGSKVRIQPASEKKQNKKEKIGECGDQKWPRSNQNITLRTESKLQSLGVRAVWGSMRCSEKSSLRHTHVPTRSHSARGLA